jgi:NAD(P)-dependent dehydrogenase (short-subunit alcohol dehydrogenase family)
MSTTAVVAGVGPGFCERLAERLGEAGYDVALLGRSGDYLEREAERLRAAGIDARGIRTDITDREAVADAFAEIDRTLGPVEVLALTASTTTDDERGGTNPDRFEKMWRIYALGSLLCFRAAEDDLLETGGTVLFFGALETAGDTAFRSGKDAAYGLARSLYDEYAPAGVHVARVRIAGEILNPDVIEREDDPDPAAYLDPDDAAKTCVHVAEQDERTQSFDVDLRPAAEGLY